MADQGLIYIHIIHMNICRLRTKEREKSDKYLQTKNKGKRKV